VKNNKADQFSKN